MDHKQPLAMTFLALAVSSSCIAADYQDLNDIPFQDSHFKTCVLSQKILSSMTMKWMTM
ncbi:hypothetical protein HWQ46_19225 [Shewanella sp. D64]|uniref:hypothetical protein n=1 Tax=unclassified Shewanella TaxID=196818 RepID=UPI0022BA5F4B|nr:MULTISPECIES: hypothetical protein [unclassified Shewanella]MEC4727681.1 hypothetical protein [Shewanella sp. D64]MEC4739746.1 hypothetical protein [Shewanella sp. E94]WBJ94077.1 hypothetical protein HWQ47_19540 [Shewanella sp. MTB7]